MMNWCGLPSRKTHHNSDNMGQPVLRDTQNSQDSAFSSHMMSSQIASSQCSDYSQAASQDMFSQSNSGQQAESSSQQGMKRMSMYEKWLSKRSLFRRDPSHSGVVDSKTTQAPQPSTSTQGTCPGTNDSCSSLTRPLIDCSLKGSDRDLLKQVTYAIHDCSNEMKSALYAVKEKLDSTAEVTNEQLAHTLTSFLEDIWKHQEKLQQAHQDQDKNQSVITELEVKLAKRESEISALEQQLLEARKDRTPRFAKAIRCELQSPQLLLQHKIEEILEWSKDTMKQQDHNLNQYIQNMEAQCNQLLSLSKAGQSHSQESEKRLLAELRKIPDKIECRQRELHAQLAGDIKNCFLLYKDDFEDTVKHFLRQNFYQQLHDSERGIALQDNKILEMFKTHVEAASGKLGDVVNKKLMKTSQQLTLLQDTLAENTQQMKDLVHTSSLETESLSHLEHRFDSFQSSLRHQLIGFMDKQSNEIKELRNQLYRHVKNWEENQALDHGAMKGTSSKCANPATSLATQGNKSYPAASCSQMNTAMLQLMKSASEKTVTNGPETDMHNSGSPLERYQHSSQNCQMNISTFTNSDVNVYPTPGSQMHNLKTPRGSVQSAVGAGNHHAACCHPFTQCEVSVTLKSGPSPAAAIVPQQSGNFQKTSMKIITPKQSMVSLRGAISNPKKHKEGKKGVSRKKNVGSENDGNMRPVTVREAMFVETGRLTRSQAKYFQKTTTETVSDQQLHQLAECHKMSVGNKVPTKTNKTRQSCNDKWDLSVYDFQENETCNLPEVTRSRKRPLDSVENMSLATFINNRNTETKKDHTFEKNSECSSPTVSITRMSIKRKVRTPFRRPFRIDVHHNPDFLIERSPAPTLLSDI